MKIAILDWPTAVAHESFSVFHRSIAHALKDLGHRTALFHDAASVEKSSARVRWDCTLAVGSHYRFFDGGAPLYERLGIPHFQWIVDTPFKARLPSGAGPLLHAIVIDREFAGFAGLPPERSLFLPLGTDVPDCPPVTQRRFDLVFTGQIKDPMQDWKTVESLPDAPRALARHLIDRVVAEPDRSLLTLFDQDRHRFDLSGELRAKAFLAANSFLRSWKRQRVMLSIRDLPVHVFGEVGDPALRASRNLRFHGSFPYSGLGDILAQTRIALNITPNFYQACHDRIIATLACGALAATDTNPYIDTHFTDGVEILAYRYAGLGSLECRLENALRKGTWKDIADAGRRVVARHFSWKKTVERLIPYMRYATTETKTSLKNYS